MGKRKHVIDIGQRFGRLVTVSPVKIPHATRTRSGWACKCDCGNAMQTVTHSLTSGTTTSCGCAHIDAITKHGHSPYRYEHRSPTYRSWLSMIQRCTNPHATHFDRYGGRGITVCERWRKFENFLADMGERPSTKHTIERINNDSNYESGNARWATRKEQSQNRASNRLIRYNNEIRTVAQWCVHLQLDQELVRGRLKLGWPFDKIVRTAVLPQYSSRQRQHHGRFGPS